jgi:hypothetical protein
MRSTLLNTLGFYRRLVAWFMMIVLVAAIFINPAQVIGSNSAKASSPAAAQKLETFPDTLAETKIYLPIIYQHYLYPTIFGAESSLSRSSIDAMVQAGMHWVRYPAFSWAEIEPKRTTPPTYHWETVDEAALRRASDNGLSVVATVKFTPSWAQKIPGSSCGPIAQDALDEFAQFMYNLVKRYGASSYGIKYWELGNEVDVDSSLVPPDSPFGCWGDQTDDYFGGGYYAQMLKSVYLAIKGADPQAQVVLGGLLVICDPTHALPSQDCKPANFLEGILNSGGGPYFDAVSFHAFAFYQYGHVYENLPTWGPRGGIVMGKIDFLREVMAKYGVNKPLLLTEASLLCQEGDPGCTPVSEEFKQAQADYVDMLYTRTWDANLLGTIWLRLEGPGWRQSGLLEGGEPKPAYNAYRFLTSELRGAFLTRSLDQLYTGVNGYEFAGYNKKIWILWAADFKDHLIDLPGNLIAVYNKYGAPIVPSGNQVTVNGPIFIEVTP